MPDFYVHILNWPCTADTPEEAAKAMYADICYNVHPYFTVTEKEGELTSPDPDNSDLVGPSWQFDAEEWYDEDGKEIE